MTGIGTTAIIMLRVPVALCLEVEGALKGPQSKDPHSTAARPIPRVAQVPLLV